MKSFQHYINTLQNLTMIYINQRRGWTTDRKIIVIESDDWGSIRMPSNAVLESLLKNQVKLRPQLGLDKYDTLASNEDLEKLIKVLYSVKDKNGNKAKITLNCVVANPDFEKIKANGFTKYEYEIFIETLKRYSNHDKSFSLWKEGIQNKIFRPQFHGREHLNVQLWMNGLHKDFPGTRYAFDSGVFCNTFDKKYDIRGRYLEAFNVAYNNEYDFVLDSIKDGLSIFENIFGFKSKSMIAPNYIWDDKVEKTVFENGVKFIQGSFIQINTIESSKSENRNKYHYLGKRNNLNQIYMTRNCIFEPTHNRKFNSNKCIEDIEKAFLLKKPAIICSHRVNYIGDLNVNNRDNNLEELYYILNYIINKYPEVEFMFSDELGELIFQTDTKK